MNLENVGGREDGQGMDQKEKRKGEGLRVENTAAYNEMFRMNCETFDESLSDL